MIVQSRQTVSRHFDLRHDGDAASCRVVDELAHLVLGVEAMVRLRFVVLVGKACAVLRQLWMLFDLEADPREMNNLIESRQDSAILVELREKCARESEALNRRRQAYRKAVEVATR